MGSLARRPREGPGKSGCNFGGTLCDRLVLARHKEASGDFARRDVWLFDRQWKRLTFRFHATDPTQKTLVYVSLLPNQVPRETTVLVDDFTVQESKSPATAATKKDELVIDGDFAKLKAGPLGDGAWSFANIGGTKIVGEVVEQKEERFFRIAMNKNTTNFESAQLWQMVTLEKGVRYEVQCRMRWENYQDGASTPIVNYGYYHEETNTWYGPIDQSLRKSRDWEVHKFVHIPPMTGSGSCMCN